MDSGFFILKTMENLDQKIEQKREEIFNEIKNTLADTTISSSTKVLMIQRLLNSLGYQIDRIVSDLG